MKKAPIKFYKWKDYINNGVHLAMGAALMVAVGYWVGPLTLLGCAAGAGALHVAGGRLMDSMMGKLFVKHDVDVHDSLKATFRHYTQKAGLAVMPTLHDFEIDKEKLKNKSDSLSNPAQIKRIMNAAATGMKKPLVIVSAPLLEALRPLEADSVIGHEFGHLGAEHIKLRLISGWMQTTTMFAAMFGFGAAIVSEGWLTTMLSLAGTIGVAYAGNKIMPKQEDRYTRDGTERPKTQRVQVGILAAQEAISVGLLALPNPPVILTAFAIEHAFFWSSNLVSKSLMRRHEFHADKTAVSMGADPLALITSLRKLERSLELNEPELARSLNWREGSVCARAFKMATSVLKTHPDTQRRCRRLAKMAQNVGYSGKAIHAALYEPVDEAHLLLPH